MSFSLITATLASIVGSQASITATFSIIKQCQALGFFPWVKVVHTSSTMHGQIYIPEVNWIMFAISLSVTVGFRNTIAIGNAYGKLGSMDNLPLIMLAVPRETAYVRSYV